MPILIFTAAVILSFPSLTFGSQLGLGETFVVLKDYVSIVGSHASSGSNSGIVAYNQGQLDRNHCLGPLAKKFYDSIDDSRTSDIKHFSATSDHPGWLWTKALLFAQNDRALAMQLIGLCGHDDLMQYMTFKDALGRKVSHCPNGNSEFYMPKSIGPLADISDELKGRVLRVQGNGSRSTESKLRPKYYHVIGSAYMACLMLEKGDSVHAVRAVSHMAIQEYRAQRLCRDSSDASTVLLNQPAPAIVTAAKQISHGRSCGSDVCKSLSQFFRHTEGLSDQDIREKVATRINRERAYSYPLGGGWRRALGCVPGLGNSLQTFLENNGTGGRQNPCRSGDSVNDCNQVRHIFSTWAIDMQWSEAQHRAGVDFATKNCSVLPKGRDPLQNACSALRIAPEVSERDSIERNQGHPPSRSAR